MSRKIYDRYIASAERRVKEIEKWLADTELKRDEDGRKFLRDVKKVWEAHAGYLKTLKSVKDTLQSLDTNTLSDMVKEALGKMGCDTRFEETMDFVRADLIAERDNGCLIVEVKELND